ncbi:MAG: hypothetical protein J6M47_01500 [Clostridia bacterium]|nr:hypothetical protein [Clostridia bacterium]
MTIINRLSALLISLCMLIAPAALAEEAYVSDYAAGELTAITLEDAYVGGEQINLTATLGLEVQPELQSERVAALASLLGKTQIHMSFYDDFGTDRIHAELTADGVEVLTADALIFEDGSLQAMTSLTGKYVLTLPAGSIVDGRFTNPNQVTLQDVDIESEEFKTLPASDRLRLSTTVLTSDLINKLLGWVSGVQVDTGELYLFDETYIEPTETRDGVAQRMIGKIMPRDFMNFLWNISAVLRDDHGEFEQALADVLAEAGVTRYQMRQVIDALFTEEEIDPAVDWVQPSWNIKDDGSLCLIDDVRYLFRKLEICTATLWWDATETPMSMIVSYDDYGGMVGFDATVPVFNTSLPYEGDFTYSIRTDDDWQRLHTSHGELQVFDGNRIVGDLDIQFGEDVGGVNASHFKGSLDMVNKEAGTKIGFDVDSALNYQLGLAESGETETFEGSAVLSLNTGDSSAPVVGAAVSGMTTLSDGGFAIEATGMVEAPGMATLVANALVERVEYEEIPFAGGQPIDLLNITEADIEAVKETVIAEGAKLSVKFVLHPGVIADLMKVIGSEK